MSRDGDNRAINGTKRPADDGFDPLTSQINLKATPPYDAKKEQAPFSVAQSKEYNTYKAHEEKLRQLLKEPLANAENADKSLQGLINTINKRIGGLKPEKIVLCLTGAMGMGKSATLNSLFGIQIAREGDHGGSCTLASCTYQAPKQDQEAAFLAQVKFFSREDRRGIIAEYLSAYYYVTHQHHDDDDPARESQQPSDEADSNADIRDEVLMAMVSLFGNQRECRTKQAVREFLDDAKSPDDENILGQLYVWCDNLIAKATCGQPVVTISASTAGELSQKLENFTTYAIDDSGNLAVSLTPMVSLINFHFDNPLTRLGIVFLDTPGTSDCNKARKKSAEEYRKYRTHCIVLSEESRAKDDSGISKEVKKLRSRGTGRTVVVVTRSDVMKDNTIPAGSKKDKERMNQLKRGLERLRNALNAVEIQEGEAAEAEDIGKIAKLAMDKRTLGIRVKFVENAEKAHRIWMRSESNKKVIEEKLHDINASAPIFSISNLEYAKHMEGYAAKNTPVLSVEETKIPQLRRLISTFPNEARLNEIEHQQQNNLPALLSRIRLYIEKSPSDRKENMEIHVNYPMKRYATELNSDFENLEQVAMELLNPLAACELPWTKAAGHLCDKWADEFKPSPFLALLRRDGRRKARTRSREVNLSAELIQINAEELDHIFHKLNNRIRHFERDISDHMESLVTEMVQCLKEDSNEPFMSLGAFYDYVDKEKNQFAGMMYATFKGIKRGLENIRTKATSEDEDAYLVQAMLPIYDQVRQLKGGKFQKAPKPKEGWPAHRRIVFKNEVTKLDRLWATVYSGIIADLKNLLVTERQHLIDRVGKVFVDFESGFNIMCEIDDAANPETAKILEELSVNRSKAEEILNGPMKQAYEALDRDFRGINVNCD